MRTALVAALLILTSCQQIEAYRKPELAACQSFIASTLKSPSSFRRADYTIMDEAVDADTLAKAVGVTKIEGALYEETKSVFVKPTIRSVLINYDAANVYGTPMRSVASCRFALSNGKQVFKSPADAADDAIRENQMRLLKAMANGGEAEAASCCLDKKFDLSDLNKPGRGSDVILVDQEKD